MSNDIKHFCVGTYAMCNRKTTYCVLHNGAQSLRMLDIFFKNFTQKNEYNFNKQFLGHWVSIVRGTRGRRKRATRTDIMPIVIRICIKMFVPVHSCGNIYLGSVKCHRQKRFDKSSKILFVLWKNAFKPSV